MVGNRYAIGSVQLIVTDNNFVVDQLWHNIIYYVINKYMK